MNINELIDACGGPNKVGIQFLDRCADTLDWSAKKGATKVTFYTDQVLGMDGLPMCGVVVWLDREKVKIAIAALSQEPKP